ncbi:MAG: bifunctional 4-hydroxy-3-methylbut-2-enyl diphosphate reductase/30S ribosomal protein S1 [Sporomusaceae bacterium]|nr:bifunctional 4-hydroxy-3-methylbut-2-enyl diphosphate reductase/30S ribosomal protein S1 [Sporomusaceae bacterium]
MKIRLARHMGFCYGVKRAVELAVSSGGAVTLGPLIHNQQVVDYLAQRGIGVAGDLDAVQSEAVIIRSHGEGPAVYDAIRARELTLLDATCPHVRKAQTAAAALKRDGRQLVILGEKNHPEVKSILAWAGDGAIAVETADEVLALPFMERLGVVVQTTFSRSLFDNLIELLRQKTADLAVERTICTATDQRQLAAVELAAECDAMVIVGGKHSANTARLASVCEQAGARTYHIETAAELRPEWFSDVKTVGITAGASTPDWIIEEVYHKMEEMNMENQEAVKLETGMIVKGKITAVQKDAAFVDIGYKSDGVIALKELAYPQPEQAADVVSVGDEIDVQVLDADSADGSVVLSKVKADKVVAWDKLQAAFEAKQPVEAKVTAAIKGGLSVAVFGVRGFVPASQADLRRVEDLSSFAGQTLTFLPIELEPEKQRVVLSRRQVLEAEQAEKEAAVLASLEQGQIVRGVVRRLASFGAFVDIGGIDALIHISDMAWQRINSPSEVLKVGDEVEAMIVKLDPAARKVGLSLKQVQPDPWLAAAAEIKEGAVIKGRVTKTAKFGAFVEINNGVEGLVHLSELAGHRVASAEEAVKPGQEVMVKVLGVDTKQKRISLSIAQAQQDAERAEYTGYLQQQHSLGVTLGDKFSQLGQLFKK